MRRRPQSPTAAKASEPRQALDRRGAIPGGFTLPEIAMAVIVLAIALVTALTALQRTYLSLDTARNLQVAGSIMQTEFEKERLMSWTQLTNAAYQPVIDSSHLRDPAIAGRFTLSRAVALVPQRNDQMLAVTLTVTWRTYDGRRLTRSYLTYFGRGGLYNFIYENA